MVEPNTRVPIDWQLRYAWMLENERSRATIEHYIVRWSVENLSLLPEEEWKCISSPYFALDASKTAWCFKLFPNIFRNGQKLAYFSLQRLSDRGPKTVGITYKFGVENSLKKVIWFKEQKREHFEIGSIDGVHIQAFEFMHRLPSVELVVKDTLKVVCEMYIVYHIDQYIDDSLSAKDYDLVNLSADLIKLMRSKESSDYCIKIRNYEIVLHKSILAARSPVFKEILKDERFKTSYDLLDVSYSNVTSLLLFMYSGSFNLVSRKGCPDIGLYECAVEYAVSDLVAFLAPNYLNLKSELQTVDVECTWHLGDFGRRLTSAFNCVKSPPFKSAHAQSPEWTLTVYAKKTGNDFYKLGIFVESATQINVIHSTLKISVLDKEDKPRITKSTTVPYKPNIKFGFPHFLKKFSVKRGKPDVLVEDTLKIHCKLTFIASTDSFEEHIITFRSNKPVMYPYLNLSMDLKRLFDSGDFSDVIIKASNLTMNAHKSILFSRSKTLASKFLYSNVPKDGIVEISDIDPTVVSSMVNHAYSGIMSEVSHENLVKLLSASEKYSFSSLSLICVQFLGPAVNMGNFFELMVLGNKVNNVNLIGKCLTYAKMNTEKILNQAEWEMWKRQEPDTYDLMAQWQPVFALKK